MSDEESTQLSELVAVLDDGFDHQVRGHASPVDELAEESAEHNGTGFYTNATCLGSSVAEC